MSDSDTMSGEAAMAGDAGAVHEVKQFWRGPLESLHSLVSRAVIFGGGVGVSSLLVICVFIQGF